MAEVQELRDEIAALQLTLKLGVDPHTGAGQSHCDCGLHGRGIDVEVSNHREGKDHAL
jgi:hypothetical protein